MSRSKPPLHAYGAQRVTVGRQPRRRAAPERKSAAVTSGATKVIAIVLFATGCFVDRSAIGGPIDAGGDDATIQIDGHVVESDGCIVAAEACNGTDDDCDGAIDEAVTEPCSTDCGAGVRTCAGGTFGECTAPPLGDETCNGTDDDCDGTIDEDLSQACSSLCGSGTETCDAGEWVGCDAPPAGVEACNGVDDDCDGTVDDGLSQACSTACGSGTETCDAGDWVGCDAPPPGLETCNGADDDCDGATDELPPRVCTNACGAPGTETCAAGTWGACTAMVGTETCNGLDDDCDGTIDDGVCTCAVRYNGGRTYLFCSSGATWTSARTACMAVGYDLVTIDSASENTYVWTIASGLSDSDWWIGLNDRTTEDTWRWASGSTATYREWGTGQPGGPGEQDCVALTDGSEGFETRGEWNDADCGTSYRYVCEVP